MDLHQVKNTLIFFENEGISTKNETQSQLQENSIYKDLIEEAGEEVYKYLEKNGLTKNTNLILLSSIRHYLFGPDELKSVKTLVNLKFLNYINYLSYFLESMNKILPIGGNFVGCFADKSNKKKIQGVNYSSRSNAVLLINFIENRSNSSFFPINWFRDVLSKRKISLTADEVRTMLIKHGFHVMNMTEINGITYFITDKVFEVKHSLSTTSSGKKTVNEVSKKATNSEK